MSDDDYIYVWREPRSGLSATSNEDVAAKKIERYGFKVYRIPEDEMEEVEVQDRLTPVGDAE